MLSALPPIYNAAPAFISTAFLLCPFSPFKMASVIAAFSSGVPPFKSSFVQRGKPNSSGVITEDLNQPSRISQTVVGALIEISSSLSCPYTTMPRLTPRLMSTCASGLTRYSSYTPRSCMDGVPGLVSGPKILNTVRNPSSLRIAPTYFMEL